MHVAEGSASTQAALIDRGNGLIYDNVLNITWIQDVATVKHSGWPGPLQLVRCELLG